MQRSTLPEPDVSRRLTFIPQTGGPIRDPAARRQIKKQIRQHVGRNMRKPGLVRRHPALQYSLEVPHTVWMDSSATDSLPTSSPHGRGKRDDVAQSDTTFSAEDVRCYSAAVRGWASEMLSFDRLGVGLLDPFMHYPFRLDDRAQELMFTVYKANSGAVAPFRVVAFRVIWVEVSIIEAAAFHQFLAGAQAYFDFLRTGQPEKHSPQVIAHRTSSLQLINAQIANAETASSDGVVASVVLLARYYQMIGDFEKWRMHMLGLKEIIRIRGDIDAIGMNDLLRHMLSNVDISGSFVLDTVPIFPVPVRLLPASRVQPPCTNLKSFAKYFITTCRSKLTEHIELIDIIGDVCLENQHLLEEISRTKNMLWTETMYICHYINPLIHRLLCLRETDRSLPSYSVTEALRLGAVIYLATIRYAFGISPFQSGEPARKIKLLLDGAGDSETEQAPSDLWQDIEWSWLKTWVLGCAAINSPSAADGQWLLHRLHAEMDKSGMETYDDFEKSAGLLLWVPEVHGLLLRNLNIQTR